VNAILKRAMSWMLALLVGVSSAVPAQDSRTFSEEDLDRLLAPVALYPDPLLSQVLMASTYPLEVVQAARWVKRNPGLKGAALDRALAGEPWDPSVKELAAFPDVIEMMNENLEWTQQLGDAVLAQQAEVMDTVQRLRRRAEAEGNLRTTPQQRVIVEEQVVRIEPADPLIVYVPVYNPTVVYGTWWWPSPPYYYYPRVYAGGSAVVAGISFGVGVALVNAFWSDLRWHDRYIHVDRNVYVNRVNVHNHNVYDRDVRIHDRDIGRWEHDPRHRRAVPYRDPGVHERFTRSGGFPAEARRPYRSPERGARDHAVAPDQRPAIQDRQQARDDLHGQHEGRSGEGPAGLPPTGRRDQDTPRRDGDRQALRQHLEASRGLSGAAEAGRPRLDGRAPPLGQDTAVRERQDLRQRLEASRGRPGAAEAGRPRLERALPQPGQDTAVRERDRQEMRQRLEASRGQAGAAEASRPRLERALPQPGQDTAVRERDRQDLRQRLEAVRGQAGAAEASRPRLERPLTQPVPDAPVRQRQQVRPPVEMPRGDPAGWGGGRQRFERPPPPPVQAEPIRQRQELQQRPEAPPPESASRQSSRPRQRDVGQPPVAYQPQQPPAPATGSGGPAPRESAPAGGGGRGRWGGGNGHRGLPADSGNRP